MLIAAHFTLLEPGRYNAYSSGNATPVWLVLPYKCPIQNLMFLPPITRQLSIVMGHHSVLYSVYNDQMSIAHPFLYIFSYLIGKEKVQTIK